MAMPVSWNDEVERALANPTVARVATAIRAHVPRVLQLDGSWRRAAVSLVMRVRGRAEPDVLFIQRASYPGDPWSGHIALPGGRHEAGDASLEATAVRETREETAIDLAGRAAVLGRLDDLEPRTTILPRIVISPFVFALGGDQTVAPSAEVADVFWVPLAVLRDPATVHDTVIQLPGGARRVTSYQHEGRVIWGLTERILRQFLDLVG